MLYGSSSQIFKFVYPELILAVITTKKETAQYTCLVQIFYCVSILTGLSKDLASSWCNWDIGSRDGNIFSDIGSYCRSAEGPKECPTHVTKEIIRMQIWGFFLTCIIVGNDSCKIFWYSSRNASSPI
jgi:hypothetical protein